MFRGIFRTYGHLWKGASFVGTTIVSIVSQITGNISIGVGMIAILFCIGTVIFFKSVSMAKKQESNTVDTNKNTGAGFVEAGTV